MKFLRILILFFIFQFALNIHAQVYLPNAKTCDENSIGLGIGQDFGGIGIGVLHYGGNKNMGIFGGIGYTPAGIGFNGGLKLRLIPSNRTATVNPFILGMYGYTTAISVTNYTQYNKTFYGSTLGGGFDLKLRKSGRGFWTLALLFPIDNSKANEYIQYLKVDQGITFSTEQSSLRCSIGYRYLLN